MEPSWRSICANRRVTEADRQIQERLWRFHRGGEKLKVSHFLAPETSRSAPGAGGKEEP